MAALSGVAALKKYHVKTAGVVFMLFCLVSAGAFGIEEMIPASGPGMTLILLTVFPLIWAYPISSMVSECGSAFPAEGGVYVWVRRAYGEFWGFLAGWAITMSSYITIGVYVALAAGYASQLLPMTEASLIALKLGMIILFTIINVLGIKSVENVSTALSILIVCAFALVTVVGFMNWSANPVEVITPEGVTPLESIGEGICICIWMYCGYECVSSLAGEVKNPQVIPRGMKIAMPLVALTYILPTLAGLAALPQGSWELWAVDPALGGEHMGYASVLMTHLGDMWGYIFLVVSIISQCAIFNMYLASGSRGFFVLSDDNLFPRALSRVSARTGVPVVGILSMAVVAMVLSQFEFAILVSVEVVFDMSIYIMLALAVVKLRQLVPIEERRKRGLYVMPGGQRGLVFFVGAPLVIASAALLLNGTDYLALGLIGMCSGPVAYVLLKRRYGGLTLKDPEAYELNPETRLDRGDTGRIGVFMSVIGAFAFFGQIWLRYYEGVLGQWVAEDYDFFGEMIPQIQDGLLIVGLLMFVVGVLVVLIARRRGDVPVHMPNLSSDMVRDLPDLLVPERV